MINIRIGISIVTQALPYVALLVALVFFIYGVVGMQVGTFFNFSDNFR